MPDRFRLVGNKSQNLIMVGNAVPPLLAAAVATQLGETLGCRVPNRYGIETYLDI